LINSLFLTDPNQFAEGMKNKTFRIKLNQVIRNIKIHTPEFLYGANIPVKYFLLIGISTHDFNFIL